ncbi:TPA_asm: hypothetical protein HUJ06_000024 [Nelumbo nucifera]|uniref:Uncharacterized protein n=1 Tax=Nelumbo nucifera TaxID=4432 RepID=A0A822ZTN2_NELNU|nr:TPA_asm: hypothetical protein HUJ06_000024 [Nelumbo nucifera]
MAASRLLGVALDTLSRGLLANNQLRARMAPRNLHGRVHNPNIVGWFASIFKKRLSATDISALASMKNVAKCDTWCELQNPVNHRVFERKLRPRPLSQGHACLGVTHRCPSLPFPFGVGELVQMLASRSVLVRLAQMMAPPTIKCHDGWWFNLRWWNAGRRARCVVIGVSSV